MMSYLCDLCRYARPKNGWLLIPRCFAQNGVYVVNKPIDYCEQDPHKICMYFKRKKHGTIRPKPSRMQTTGGGDEAFQV